MAAKKTAKKSTETPESAATPAPVAKKAAKKVAAKAAKKAPAKKAASPKSSSASKPAAGTSGSAQPSPDAIARAAYLNYRRRVEQGLPGDSSSDWLEAERQLG
jgi:hypothetical protein